MKTPKSRVQEQDQRGVARLLRFLGRHFEKMVAGAVILMAMAFALPIWNHPSLSWQPDELETPAKNTETAISKGTYTAADAGIAMFDYASHAEHITEWIPSPPYRHEAAWYPNIYPTVIPCSGVEMLTAESLTCESVRRTGLKPQENSLEQWQRPSLPEVPENAHVTPLWVNIYGTIPAEKQWSVYHHVFVQSAVMYEPEYVYYELEKAEIKPKEEPVWLPVVVYPGYTNDDSFEQREIDSFSDVSLDRLVPLGQAQETFSAGNSLLFSDFDVEPAKSYAYRLRLYLVNPHYNRQESSVQPGVDTTSRLLRSEWSRLAKVAMQDRLSVQLRSVTPADSADFPRQASPLGRIRGTVILDYFDVEMGVSLPPVEKADVYRGMLCNVSKAAANRAVNQGVVVAGEISYNYPEEGLRSDVCVLDFNGGRKLQKRNTSAARMSPDLSVAGKALLLMPDGTMQITTTEPDLFR